MTSGWRVYTDTHSQAYFFSEISLSDTHVTHSAHFSTFTHQGRIERSFHQTIRRWLVVLECDGDHFHFHELTPLHLRNKSRCRLAALHHTNTGNEHPVNTVNSEMDTSRARFCSSRGFDARRWRHKFSHVRHSVAASRECTFSVEHYCIGDVLTSLERPCATLFTVSDRYPIRLEWIFGNDSILLRILKVYLQFLDLKKLFQLVAQRAREALYDQRETARRSLLPQQGEFLAATHRYEAAARKNLINTWRETMNHTITACRCKFGNSNMRCAIFPKTKGTVIATSLRKQIKLLKISEKI